MRLTERLMWLLGVGLAIVYGLEEFWWCIGFIIAITIIIIIACATEGLRSF